MAEEVFADSQGWIALLNRSDQDHAAARETMRAYARDRRRIVTTDWILAETGNGLARSDARAQFVEAIRRLQASASASIIRVNDKYFERALDMFKRASDKNWGLVDCSSFVVMRERGISEAFTNDHHFVQAGFSCSLSEPRP